MGWAPVSEPVWGPAELRGIGSSRLHLHVLAPRRDDKIQKIEPRKVEREGDRFFIVMLPGDAVRRLRQHQSGAVEWVESIPGGDPE